MSRSLMWGQPHLRQTQGRLSAVRPGKAGLSATLLALMMASVTAVPFSARAQKPAAPKPTEDLPSGSMQAKATTSCLECHEARIILQQRLSKAAWSKEVDKMIKWGAVVDANDHDALIDYLSANFGPDQPAYDPPRTTLEKTSGKNGATKPSK
jgi:cell division septation protein DedD